MKEKKTVNWILKNYPYTIGEEVCDILRKYRDGRLVERLRSEIERPPNAVDDWGSP